MAENARQKSLISKLPVAQVFPPAKTARAINRNCGRQRFLAQSEDRIENNVSQIRFK
jgi:hypothetical protein